MARKKAAVKAEKPKKTMIEKPKAATPAPSPLPPRVCEFHQKYPKRHFPGCTCRP